MVYQYFRELLILGFMLIEICSTQAQVIQKNNMCMLALFLKKCVHVVDYFLRSKYFGEKRPPLLLNEFN